MILDKEIKLNIKSSKIIFKLKELSINSKIGDIIILPIEKLWSGSNIKINVKCDVCECKKNIKYQEYNRNYLKYKLYCCSNKCSYIKNKKTSLERYGDENYTNPDKVKQTKLERYGDENYTNIKKIKDSKLEKYGDENYNNRIKYKQTILEKYGVENTFQVTEFQKKTKQTNLEKYGVEDSRSSSYVNNKRKKTKLEKHGDEYYNNRDKCKITNLERYGYDSSNKSPLIKFKKVKSMISKYGYISNSLTKESKEKLKNTNLERYGVEYPMQVIEFSSKQQKNAKKIEYYNDNLYFQGSYEKDFLTYMNNLGNIDLIKRGNMIKYEFEGKNKIHYPDFYIEKYNLIIEIKSSYYYNKHLDKNKSKMEACINLGYNYIFIINKNYSILDNILN